MKRWLLIVLSAVLLFGLSACGDGKPDDTVTGTEGPGQDTAPGTDPIVVTEPPETEPQPVTELKDSGWCAVGFTEGEYATLLADTGAVVSLKYTGTVTPGLIHRYTYDRANKTVALSLAPTFPQVADYDGGGNDLSEWLMGAYPGSNSIWYGGSYLFSSDTPVFVRYSNVEWRLGHGKEAFASQGITRGYIGANGSNLDFVMIVGACGSLENMQPANADVTACMDPAGNGFNRGNIMLDGSAVPEDKVEENLDENGLTIPDASKKTQTLTYKKVNGKSLLMSLYQPTVQVYEKAPVYFLITGGGWNTCDRQGMIGFASTSMEALRKKGFAVTSIDYRIMPDGADMAAIISDCMDGVRYLIRYADEAGIDPDKIVVAGHSAGGHLALMTAIGDQSLFTDQSIFGNEHPYQVLGCVSMSGLTICYNVDGKLLTAVSHLPQLFKSEEAKHQASPYDYIRADMCPVLVTTGTDDQAVDAENTYFFRDKAAEVGANVTTIISEHAGHSYEPMNGASSVSVTFSQLQNEVAAYIAALVQP